MYSLHCSHMVNFHRLCRQRTVIKGVPSIRHIRDQEQRGLEKRWVGEDKERLKVNSTFRGFKTEIKGEAGVKENCATLHLPSSFLLPPFPLTLLFQERLHKREGRKLSGLLTIASHALELGYRGVEIQYTFH